VTLFASITGAGSAVGAFASFVDSALGKTLSPPFTPYDSNLDFLLGAYILEDVLVTAYEVRATDSPAGQSIDGQACKFLLPVCSCSGSD